jgi:hypothetical protein
MRASRTKFASFSDVDANKRRLLRPLLRSISKCEYNFSTDP